MDHDEILVNEVVIPLMNVSRKLPDGTINPTEPNQQVIALTSAGTKSSFGYSRLIDTFENSIIDPRNSFVFGCDYRIPVMHGLLDDSFINKLKMSPSYNEESFAKEFASIWGGGDPDAWFSYDSLQKYRKLKNPETHAINRAGSEKFYLLSVDVGRIHDKTVVTVFRVTRHVNGKYYTSVVNIYILGRDGNHNSFHKQAIELKKIIKAFNPKEVVIDTNGLTTNRSFKTLLTAGNP